MQRNLQNQTYFPATSNPFGISYGKWTVMWWNWALSIPISINPLIDETGNNANINQKKNVWFLAGKLADRDSRFPYRRCTIPAGTSILFPIINCEANILEYGDKNENGLIEYVVSHADNMTDKECLVDGEMVPGLRIASDPKIFEMDVHKENIFRIPKSGKTIASADGYWVFLKPLEIGEHVIEFHGSCSSGANKSGSKYILNIY
ncbi:MAG TPA: hypothetical protein VJS91_04725 [Nitrososphaeraceae archaeon]|nr:hypothetical protein [Nitrososphaeraceae archaeon]